MFYRRALILFAIASLIAACSNHRVRVDQGVLIEPETLNYLQSGLTQDQVRKLLGPAANISSFRPNRWEYLFQSNDPNFQTDKVKKLVLEFDGQGYLSKWTQGD